MSSDDTLGGGFADIRGGSTVDTITRLSNLTAAPPQETPVTTTAPEPTDQAPTDTPVDTSPADGPTHAGIAVQAADTGRILMQQRAWDEDDDPAVRGTWEFPGGGLEDGEAPLDGAWREWMEETGLPQPADTDGEITGGWVSDDGVYQCFVFTVPTETTLGPLNPDKVRSTTVNPDDPERDDPDITAWFTQEQIKDMGTAVRPEVQAQTDWSQFAPTPKPTAPPANPEEAEDVPATTTAQGVLEAFARHIAGTGDPAPILARLQETFSGLTMATTPPAPTDTPAAPDTPPQDAPQAETPLDQMAGDPFYGIIWPEGVQSGDMRAVDPGATTNRDLPLPLMAQDAQEPGHDGAVRVGRIDTITRDDTTYSVPVMRYTGTWDTSPIATETKRQVDAGVVRGISTDGDAVQVELRASDGSVLDPMVDDFPADGQVTEVATAARISGGTVCSVPAFHQAYIANGTLEARTTPEPGWNDDGTPKDNTIPAPAQGKGTPEGVVASAWTFAASAETEVPADVFLRPDALDDNPDGTPLTVTASGHVYGHLAVWGTCHIGIDGLCQEPPASNTNYAYFATGAVLTSSGVQATGPLVMETGHAGLTLGHRAAASHYDNTGTAVADVVMGQDHIGIWYSGAIRPGTTPEQVYALRASGKVSGDWRNIGGNLELVAALVVNTPGFSIPRPALAASAGRAQAMVAAGIVRTPHPAEEPVTVAAVASAVVATLDRRTRAQAALARLDHRRAAARTAQHAALAARISGRK